MGLAANFDDNTATASVHAQHHNDIATALNNPCAPPKIAGWWYDQRMIDATSPGSQYSTAANRLQFQPIYLPWSATLDRFGLYVPTAAAGATIRIATYAMSPTTGLPTGSPADHGTVDVSTTGAKTVTLSAAMAQGWFYLALLPSNAVANGLRAIAGGAPLAIGSEDPLTVNGAPCSALYIGGVSVLPDPPPATRSSYTSVFAGTTLPAIYYRVAS